MPVLIGDIVYDTELSSSGYSRGNKAVNELATILDPILQSLGAVKTVTTESSNVLIRYSMDNDKIVLQVRSELSTEIMWVQGFIFRNNTGESPLYYTGPEYSSVSFTGTKFSYRIIYGEGGVMIGFKKDGADLYSCDFCIQKFIDLNTDQIVYGIIGGTNVPLYPTITALNYKCNILGTSTSTMVSTDARNAIEKTDGKISVSKTFCCIDASGGGFTHEAIGMREVYPYNVNAKITASNGKTYASFGNMWMEI